MYIIISFFIGFNIPGIVIVLVFYSIFNEIILQEYWILISWYSTFSYFLKFAILFPSISSGILGEHCILQEWLPLLSGFIHNGGYIWIPGSWQMIVEQW